VESLRKKQSLTPTVDVKGLRRHTRGRQAKIEVGAFVWKLEEGEGQWGNNQRDKRQGKR